MSNEEALNFKSYRQEPFYQYFVGDGSAGDACFPGDIFKWMAEPDSAASPLVGSMQ